VNQILFGDCREIMEDWRLLGVKVQTCVTSPPYFGLRDYGVEGQLGLEQTPQEYVDNMVEVFRLVRDLLADDGTLWLNLGDSYAGSWGNQGRKETRGSQRAINGEMMQPVLDGRYPAKKSNTGKIPEGSGLKPKDLIGIPWRVALALQQPYVNWLIKSEAMRAWAGGIVDGEGCITILKTKSSHCDSLSFPPIVQVRMTDLEPLQRLVDIAGSSFGKPQLPPSHILGNQRESYQWKLVSNQASQFIAEIYPYLTCKKRQAIVAWNHQQFRKTRGNQERKTGEIEKELFCKNLINRLNQRETVDLPSWMLEPRVVQEPGFYLRQDLIWHKPNPMPESIRDRCTKAHEYIFLLSKSPKYYFDSEAIKEPVAESSKARLSQPMLEQQIGSTRVPGKTNGNMKAVGQKDVRNRRSVWTVTTKPYKGAHFATFPMDLIEPCILAGSRPDDIVLDPFMGSGTTAQVALKHGRRYLGCELNPAYKELQDKRLKNV